MKVIARESKYLAELTYDTGVAKSLSDSFWFLCTNRRGLP